MPAPEAPRVPVKYIGRHAQTRDTIYGTGEWENGQVRLIVETTALRMFKHVDAYVPATNDEAVDAATEKTKTEVLESAKVIDEAQMQEARDSIVNMTKDQLTDYAAVHYGQKLDGRQTRDQMLAQVNQYIDRFGAQ